VGMIVVGLAGDRLCEITHFETALAPYFGLPRTLDQAVRHRTRVGSI
jgi:hypothetical protein